MRAKKALIIGCDGQDGRYLSAYLGGLGYEIDRMGSGYAEVAGQRLAARLTSPDELRQVVCGSQPDEIYHLAAYHHSSEARPQGDAEEISQSIKINTLSVVNLLDSVAACSPGSKVFYASSSRVFGQPAASPQDETTPLAPVCPYGISKAAAMNVLRYYRDTHGLFACSGILYNHESPVRNSTFLSQKAALAAARAARGEAGARLTLHGSLDAVVDWSHAQDVVRAMHAILSLDAPRDFIVASGIGRTVRDLVACAFQCVGLDWRNWTDAKLANDPTPPGATALIGNSKALCAATGWKAQYDFDDMIHEMVKQVMDDGSSR